MPERDFELYLSLLSRFLRLKPAQRDEIADELRDHLEARLEELAAQGLSREEAIRAALDEFGDAAELANHFTQAAHIRKRRLIMRLTFGSAAALAVSLLLVTAFWPESHRTPALQEVVAQVAGTGAKPTGRAVADDDADKAAVEAKLAKQLGKVEFTGMPLGEVLEYIGDQIEVDIIVVRENGEEVTDVNELVELRIKRAKLAARTALDLVLEPLGLGYTIRDGLILVTTSAQANQIQVYNVRDLLRAGPLNTEVVPAAGMMGGMGGGMGGMAGAGSGMGGMGGGFFQVATSDDEAAEESSPADDAGRAGPGGLQLAQGFGGAAGQAPAGGKGGMAGPGMGMGMGMGGMGGGTPWGVIRQTHSLAQVIATTIDPASWDQNGGNGSIVQYHELLVVKNSQAVHGKIKALLEMMRASAREMPEDQAEGDIAPRTPGAGGAGALKAGADESPIPGKAPAAGRAGAPDNPLPRTPGPQKR
jgi:hypothetical protein